MVFYISAAVSVFGAVVYGLFSNSEVAEWADIRTHTVLEIDVPPREKAGMLTKEKGV